MDRRQFFGALAMVPSLGLLATSRPRSTLVYTVLRDVRCVMIRGNYFDRVRFLDHYLTVLHGGNHWRSLPETKLIHKAYLATETLCVCINTPQTVEAYEVARQRMGGQERAE